MVFSLSLISAWVLLPLSYGSADFFLPVIVLGCSPFAHSLSILSCRSFPCDSLTFPTLSLITQRTLTFFNFPPIHHLLSVPLIWPWTLLWIVSPVFLYKLCQQAIRMGRGDVLYFIAFSHSLLPINILGLFQFGFGGLSVCREAVREFRL